MSEALENRIEQARPRRFRPYPEYKDSGVEWLGEIPAHWEASRTKYVARLESGHTPSRSRPEYWEDCSIPWFGLADVWQIRDGRREYVVDTAEKVSEVGLANSSARLLPKGTVILSRTASVGFSAIMGVEMATTQDFVNWVCGGRIRPEYLLYIFRSMGQEFQRLTMGSTHQTIYMPDVANFSTAVPPLREQRAIVAFIRCETAKIDGLVARKERLIELLQEKRTALITRAVTRGLDPNVPTKDSGVEWLGNIPAHWEVVRTKYVLTERISGPFGSSLTKDSYGGNCYRVYGQEQVIPGDFTVGDYFIPEEKFLRMARYAVRPGDVLLSCVGTFGKVAAVPDDVKPGIINPRLILLRSDQRVILPEYLKMFLSSEVAFTQMDQITRGGTMDIINLSTVSALVTPLPPMVEQAEMLENVRQGASRVDALIAKVREAIERLKEFRTALISAAVTGKIDVREGAA